jgi:hypothetical protein
MPTIAEKLELVKVPAVKVWTKAEAQRSPGHEKPCFSANFPQNCLKRRKFLTDECEFCRIIDVIE